MDRIKPLISVIVPVYNADKFLRRCLDSILNQTLTEFELLLVNDGSTDLSEQICDEYKELDGRVFVFHTENRGVSSARNIGIKNARGQYSIHVDSDDFIESNMLESLYATALTFSADIVVCDFFIIFENKISQVSQGGFKNNNDFISMLLTSDLHGSFCNKLIRTNLYKKYSIKCPENVSIREDMYVSISLLLQDVKVHYLNRAYYYYFKNPYSLTATNGKKQIEKHLKGASEIISLLSSYPEFNKQLTTFKLQIRMDVFALSETGSIIKQIYPETNNYLIIESKLPLWIRVGMSSSIWGKGILSRFILKFRKHIKGYKFWRFKSILSLYK